MTIALDDFASGDTDYIAKLNSNNTLLETAINDLEVLVDVAAGVPYDLATFYPGVPGNSQLLARIKLARAVTFPINLTGSLADARVAATASTTVTLKKNGSSIGTLVWAASGTSGAFTFAAAVSFAAGDVLTLEGPATADVTLADISITLIGTR